MRVDYSVKSGGLIVIYFFIFFDMKLCCVLSLESPHRGDSNKNTQYTIFNMNKKNTLNYPKSAAMGFFLRTQKRVRNSRCKRAISVRAIEVLLYYDYTLSKQSKFYYTPNSRRNLLIPG